VPVSWNAASDPDGNLTGYKLERRLDTGSWSQIYQANSLSTNDTLALNQAENSVTYRVKAYDSAGAESAYRTSSAIPVTNNQAPTVPASVTVPTVASGGGNNAISWAASADPEGEAVSYSLERKLDSGGWAEVYTGTLLSYVDSGIPLGANTSVQWRVRSRDASGNYSAYTTSPVRNIDNTSAPTITTSQAAAIGTVNAAFSFNYVINDADGDGVTVTERLDGAITKTYSATLGQSQLYSFSAANWQKILNGAHTIVITATDSTNKSVSKTFTFTKLVTTLAVSLDPPLQVLDPITKAIMSLMGSIPADAVVTLEVTNNGLDDSPVWEDAMGDLLSGSTYFFTNTTAVNGYAFNFRLSVSRGASGVGGTITGLGGAFA
jgi:hypothetical protein